MGNWLGMNFRPLFYASNKYRANLTRYSVLKRNLISKFEYIVFSILWSIKPSYSLVRLSYTLTIKYHINQAPKETNLIPEQSCSSKS